MAVYKPKTYYPMAFCIGEGIPIAVSHTKCKKGAKVNWIHFREGNVEFRKLYEFDLKGAKKGDKIYCPVCNSQIDFRFWMSDSIPHIVEFTKDVSGNIAHSNGDSTITVEEDKNERRK